MTQPSSISIGRLAESKVDSQKMLPLATSMFPVSGDASCNVDRALVRSAHVCVACLSSSKKEEFRNGPTMETVSSVSMKCLYVPEKGSTKQALQCSFTILSSSGSAASILKF